MLYSYWMQSGNRRPTKSYHLVSGHINTLWVDCTYFAKSCAANLNINLSPYLTHAMLVLQAWPALQGNIQSLQVTNHTMELIEEALLLCYPLVHVQDSQLPDMLRLLNLEQLCAYIISSLFIFVVVAVLRVN